MHKVWLADDDEAIRIVLEESLKNSGYATTTFSNASDLIEELNSDIPDLIITDVHMPGMHGYDLLKHINNNYNALFSQYISSINKLKDIISTNKKEILMIGKFTTFKNRMDTSYYELLDYLSNNTNYTFIFVDSATCEKNKPLNYYINKYCSTKEPLIYNIVYTHHSEQIISDLANTNLKTIYEIEDCYEVDNLIHNINTFNYNYVIYRYNCEQMNYIMSKCNTKFIHYPHYINTDIFNKTETNKSIDILLYGNISDFYPFRQRLFNLIKKSGLNYYHLPHPGYNEYLNENNPNKIIGKDLSRLINKAKITLSTCSKFNYFLKKYIEISLSGSVIAGNFPSTETNIYKDCMCLLEENDSDEEIIKKINHILNLSSHDYNKIIDHSYNVSIENHNYIQANKHFDKIINYIYNN